MKMGDIACPICGAVPRGTLELCVAEFAGGYASEDVEWSGSIDTDDSTTLYENGLPTLICTNGHTYQHVNFTADFLTNLG